MVVPAVGKIVLLTMSVNALGPWKLGLPHICCVETLHFEFKAPQMLVMEPAISAGERS